MMLRFYCSTRRRMNPTVVSRRVTHPISRLTCTIRHACSQSILPALSSGAGSIAITRDHDLPRWTSARRRLQIELSSYFLTRTVSKTCQKGHEELHRTYENRTEGGRRRQLLSCQNVSCVHCGEQRDQHSKWFLKLSVIDPCSSAGSLLESRRAPVRLSTFGGMSWLR